jgi:hypothetical protein
VGRGRALALIAGCALALTGCANTTTFTASEFVDKVNSEGVSMVLGKRLANGGEAKELFAVRLPPLPGEPPPPPGTEGGPGASGTLYVYGGTGSAGDRLDACRNSGGLQCFRAQNIVVVLEDGGLEAARLGVAIRRLASR